MFISIHILMTIFLLTALHMHYNTKALMLINKVFGTVLWIVLIHNLSFYPVWIMSLDRYYYLYYAAPFLLCYGPLLYFYFQISLYEKIPRRLIISHLLPIIIAWIAFFIFVFIPENKGQPPAFYYTILYSCTGISLFVYAISIFLERRQTVHTAKNIYCAWYFLLFSLYILIMVSQMLLSSYQYKRFGTDNNKMVTNLFLLFGVLILFTEAFQRFKSKFQMDYRQAGIKPTVLVKNNALDTQPANESLDANTIDDFQLLDNYFSSDAIRNMELNLKIAASHLGITQKKLLELILSFYGDSFAKLLVKKRIEYASRILLSPEFDESYEKLPQLCGFRSTASFYRNFRSLLHCSPTRFRHRYLEKINQDYHKKNM